MLRQILIALDGSKHADVAFDLAVELAVPYGAILHIQFVAPPGLSSAAVNQLARIEILPAALQKQLQDARMIDTEVLTAVGREILANAERRATAAGLVQVHTRLDEGDPASEILAYANREKVDLIVLGSRGLGLIREILIGSVSNKLLHLSSRPCCIVKLPKEQSLFGRLQTLS